MVLQILKMQQALAAISVTIILLGSIIISDACNIEPDESIRLQIQAAQKQEKARTVTVKTKKRVLPIEANAADMALYANTEGKNKSNEKSAGVLKPRSMDSNTNETSKRNLLDELLDTRIDSEIRSNETQSFNTPLPGQLGNGESTIHSYNPSPSWLESYIMNQQENSLFSNDKNLEQKTSDVSEKQNLDIITEKNNTTALLERKYSDEQHTGQQNTDSATQNSRGLYLTTLLTEETFKLETVTETSKSTLISDKSVPKDLHTTQTADGKTHPESDTNVFQLVPLLETQTPWFLDEQTSVQDNIKQISMAPASKIPELTKSITDIPTTKSIPMNQSTEELGKNFQNSTVLNNMEEMSGAESSTEYNFIRPTRTLHNTTATIGETFSTESNKQHSSVLLKGQETQTPTKMQQNNLNNSTKETNVKSSQEDKVTIESVNYTLEGRPQSHSDDRQITHGSTISEEKTSISPNVGSTNSVPFTGSTWLRERQTRLRAYIEPFPTTPLPKSDSNGSHIFESTMGNYNATTATTEETSNSFNTTLVTTKGTTYNNIHKETSSFMKELTSTLRRQYDNTNFPGKYDILEYIQNPEKLNNEEFDIQTEKYNVETSVKSNDTPKAPEETFNTDSAISPLKITQQQTHDVGHVTGVSDTSNSVGYKSSLEYNTEFQRTNSQSSTDFSNNTPLPYHPQNIGTGTPPSSVGETGCTIIRTDANTNMPQPSEQQRENSTEGYGRKSGQYATPHRNTLSKGRSYTEGASTNNSSNNSKPDLFYMTPLHKLQVHESNNNDTNNTTEEEQEEEEVQSTTTGNQKENESDHKNNRYSSSLGSLSNDNLNNITLPPDQVLSPENIGKEKKHSVTDSVPGPFQFLQSIGKHSFNVTERPQEYISEPDTSAPQLAKHANMEVTTEKLTEESHITHSHLSQSLESITELYNLKNLPTTNAVVSPPHGQYVEPIMYFNTSIDKEFSEGNGTTSSEGNFDETTDSLDSNHTGGIKHSAILPAQEEKEPGTHYELKSQKAGSENLPQEQNQTQTGSVQKDESQHFMPISDGVSFIGLNGNTLFPAVTTPNNYNQVPPFFLHEEPHQQGEEFSQWSQHLPNGGSIGDQFAHQPQVPQYLPHEDIGGAPYTQHPFPHYPPSEEPPMDSFNVPPFIHHNIPNNNLIFEPYRRNSPDPYQFPLEGSTNVSDPKYKWQHLEKEPNFLQKPPQPPQPLTECQYYPVNQLRICVESLKNKPNQKITDNLSKDAKKHSLGELLDHDPQSENLGTSDSSMEYSNDYITIDNTNPSSPEVPPREPPLLAKDVMYEENTYDHQEQQPIYSEAFNESPNEQSFRGHQGYNTPFLDQSAQDFNTQNYPNNLGDAHIHYDNAFSNHPIGFNQDIIPQDQQIYHEINSNGPIIETEFNKEQFTPSELNQQGGEMFTPEGPTAEEETAMPSSPIRDELYDAGPFKPFANHYYRNIVPHIDNSFLVQPHEIYNQGPFDNKQFPGNEGDGIPIQEYPNAPVFQQQNIHGQFIPPREIINNPEIGHVNGRYFESDPRFQRAENYYW